MALRLNSLQTRMALTTITIVAGVLVANAAYLFLNQRSELRQDIEQRATTFALLSRQPICEGYQTYYDSGFYRFRQLMKGYLESEPDIEAIRIVSVSGELLFDSVDLKGSSPSKQPAMPPRLIRERDRLDAVKGLETTRLPALDSTGAPALEIVAPYLEGWGRHKLTILYRVHYRNLPERVAEAAYRVAGITLLSILASVLGTVALTFRLTPEAVPPPG